MIDWLAGLDPRIWQAVVAGVFVAMGWVVNGARERRAARALRAERLRDLHRALFAEIGVQVTNLGSEARIRADAAPLLARMEADEAFVPFIPRERGDAVFRSALEDLSILPRVTIDPIVAFHAQLAALAALTEDMRGASFKRLSADRRRAIYLDYVEMKVQAFRFGRIATHLIYVYAQDGKDVAEEKAEALKVIDPPVTGPLSSPDADPSGR